LTLNQQRQLHNGSFQGVLIFMHALQDIREGVFGGWHGFDSIRGGAGSVAVGQGMKKPGAVPGSHVLQVSE
jgi:hypothetical protein